MDIKDKPQNFTWALQENFQYAKTLEPTQERVIADLLERSATVHSETWSSKSFILSIIYLFFIF
jgi:hypothetical protein